MVQGMRERHYYSAPAIAVSALFGGPLAAVAFAAIEARALGRLRRDLPWLALGIVVVLAAGVLAADSGLLDVALRDLGTRAVPTWEHVAYRIAALGYVAAYWWLHREERRALAAAGVPPVPGYGAGVVALLAGLVAGTLLLVALR